MSDEEFFLLWHRRLADVYFLAGLQTSKPMSANDFLHFGCPKPKQVEWKEMHAKARADFEKLSGRS